MVTRLSRTLRRALAHNRSEQVTLAEELAVVDDYRPSRQSTSNSACR